MGSCMSSTQPIIMPQSNVPEKVSEKDVEILMEQIADEIRLEEDEKLRQTLRHLNTI
ncbi:uncharacterized protein METZ01_LOCUS359237 [marine metagenome]|uniref:Uncharacterized protein n=1 Tax=marine metagenome TaxID=408172 RepID=A0A382S942_9ZZZZ